MPLRKHTYTYTIPNIELYRVRTHLLGTDKELQKKKAALYILNLKKIQLFNM